MVVGYNDVDYREVVEWVFYSYKYKKNIGCWKSELLRLYCLKIIIMLFYFLK